VCNSLVSNDLGLFLFIFVMWHSWHEYCVIIYRIGVRVGSVGLETIEKKS